MTEWCIYNARKGWGITMQMRDMKFGDLFKVGFWMYIAATVPLLLLYGFVFAAVMFPLIQAATAEQALQSGGSDPELPTAAIVALVIGVVIFYAAFIAAMTALYAALGAMVIRLRLKMFPGKKSEADA